MEVNFSEEEFMGMFKTILDNILGIREALINVSAISDTIESDVFNSITIPLEKSAIALTKLFVTPMDARDEEDFINKVKEFLYGKINFEAFNKLLDETIINHPTKEG